MNPWESADEMPSPSWPEHPRSFFTQVSSAEWRSGNSKGTLRRLERETEGVPGSRMVPRCQIRHLGTLGTTVGCGGRRLVRAQHLHTGQPAKQGSRGAIWTSFQVRPQRYLQDLDGRQVRSRPSDSALQKGGSKVLHDDGGPPRQLRPLGLEAPDRKSTRLNSSHLG